MAHPQGRGREFEKRIEATFPFYAKAHIARLAAMPLPTRPVGLRDGRPAFTITGKPPFDVYGYLVAGGRMVGAELKSSQRATRLPIVPPGSKGNGLQFHQLDALAGLAQAGGLARVVWDNGGELGVLLGSEIINVWRVYEHVLKSQASGKDVAPGARSIEWDKFVQPGSTEIAVPVDWLMSCRQ